MCIYVCIYGEKERERWCRCLVTGSGPRRRLSRVMAMAMVVGGDVGEFDKVASFV